MYQVQERLPVKLSLMRRAKLFLGRERQNLTPRCDYDPLFSDVYENIGASIEEGDYAGARNELVAFWRSIPSMPSGGFGVMGVDERARYFCREQSVRIAALEDIDFLRPLGVETPIRTVLNKNRPSLKIATGNEVAGLSDAVSMGALAYVDSHVSDVPVAYDKGIIRVEGKPVIVIKTNSFLGLENLTDIAVSEAGKLGQDKLASLALLYSFGKWVAPAAMFHPNWRT